MDMDVLQVAALVAAYVGVIKAFAIPSKYYPFIAIAMATVFVLVPTGVEHVIEKISIIALTASGAYHYTKNSTSDNDNYLSVLTQPESVQKEEKP